MPVLVSRFATVLIDYDLGCTCHCHARCCNKVSTAQSYVLRCCCCCYYYYDYYYHYYHYYYYYYYSYYSCYC